MTYMPEKYILANGLRLAYEEFGSPSDSAIILIMGLGTQMISWPLSLCQGLADKGYRVIRFDNRDIGLSEKMERSPVPWGPKLLVQSALGRPINVPYELEDMAADVVGLMDALKLTRAHIVGASMGGMIAQIVSASHPERVLSLTSIMSTSGDPRLPGAHPEVARIMALRSLGLIKPSVKRLMSFQRLIESPGYPMTEDELKSKVISSLKRSIYPPGYARQMAAIMANGSRVELLKTIKVPTQIVHGRDDKLVPLECGIDTARLIPKARLEVVDGMGHNLPEALVPRLLELIAGHTESTETVGRQCVK